MNTSYQKTLFGTDGIRGKANSYPITCDMALVAGYAIGEYIKQKHKKILIIGRDTRISGPMVESALAAGAASVGVDVLLAGVIPTPGVACLCAHMEEAGAGAVISASHNPYEDNGIKFFDGNGYKLQDAEEESIERRILEQKDHGNKSQVGTIALLPDAQDRYAEFLLHPFSFEKNRLFENRTLSIVLDGANGAASPMLDKVFAKKGFLTFIIHNHPDGYNINKNCGSQYLGSIRDEVLKHKADIGLAFDGDADRLIALDENGMQITGDIILAICASHAKNHNLWDNSVVVSTVMSNMGLSHALASMGISHVRTRVGDRNVLQGMVRSKAVLGGEDSGHVVFGDYHTTGDGMFCALKLLDIILDTQKPLSELAKIMTVYPQVLENIPVTDMTRPNINNIPDIARVIKQAETRLEGRGRVLIRYSGTQPLLRVMVEGPDRTEIQECCQEICQAVGKYFSI